MRAAAAATALALLALVAGACAARKTYAGYRLLQTQPLDDERGLALAALSDQLDFWSPPRRGEGATIFVSPEDLPSVEAMLKKLDVGYEVAVADMQRVLAASEPNPAPRAGGRAISFTRFNNVTEIHAYLEDLAAQYPDLVTLLSAGSSQEGRDLKLVKISNSNGRSGKRAIFIDAGIHAREWIAPPVALYTISQLVENYEANRELVDALDWYVLPVLNPDGYDRLPSIKYTDSAIDSTVNKIISHSMLIDFCLELQERFWRKTRSNNGNPACLGVDANRNFEDNWMLVGSSSNLCSETYAGPSPASEPETQALQSFLRNIGSQLDLYLTFHSYGQYILHPWGYTVTPAEDAEQLTALARIAADAIESVRGTRYTVGGSAEVIYLTSGSSEDWAKSGAGVKYSYTVELPRGGSGFDPPASAILPVVTETFEGVRAFARFFAQRQSQP
ncbi:Zinc carboxypeptidase A 1 [Gryllus bimaculatus]|nr:Zinc carboxypeptidase A 1 [Gryllus bimaculatus]